MTTNSEAAPLGCAHVSPNHSSDRVLVSAGHEPVRVCGYHATYWLVETLNGINVLTIE